MRRIFLVFVITLLSCSAPPVADTEGDTNTQDAKKGDSDSTDDESGLDGPDSEYVCSEEGGIVRDTRNYPEFSKPAPEGDVGAFTAEELENDFEGGFPSGAFIVRETASADLGKRSGSDELYAMTNQDVHLYFGYVNERDNHPGTRMRSTVFVNYEPVHAIYRNMKGDRTEITHEGAGETFRFPIDEDVELLDIIIPAEAFERTGHQDIAVVSEAVGDNPSRYGGSTALFRLYREGFRKPDHPCLPQGELVERSYLEEQMLQERGLSYKGFTVYPRSATTVEEVKKDVILSPGETVDFRYFAGPSLNGDIPAAFAALPLLGGKVIGEPIFGVTPPPQSLEESQMVAHRGVFELTAPDEPGTYEFEITAWAEPYLAPGDEPAPGIGVPEGERTLAIMPSGREATIVVKEE